MKLFIVVNVDWFFLSHRKDVALGAQKAGWDVTVITADTGKLHKIKELGLKVINLPMERSGMSIGNGLKTYRFLKNLYKKERPDVVHHVGIKTILFGTMAAKSAGIHGVVCAVSGLGLFGNKKGLFLKGISSVLKYAFSVKNLVCIFQNYDNWDFYVRNGIIKREQGRFIKGSGADLKEFAYQPEPNEGTINVTLTARMIREKGIFILTEAAERLRSKYEGKAQFWLVGGLDDHKGALTKEDMDAVCDGNYIQWLGYRTDVKDLLTKSHIVAFPSYYNEGLPKSLIEANGVGRPIITCDKPGCNETVDDGVNGFLIPEKNVDALVEKLDLLLSDKELRQKMGKAARELAEKEFAIEMVVDKHLAIYKELLNRPN